MWQVKEELGHRVKDHLLWHMAPAIRSQLQMFVKGVWPELVKEKIAVLVKRHSDLERRRSDLQIRVAQERDLLRDRLYREARC